MLERFRTLAGGLDHPEGVAWSPRSGRVYAGGEAGQIYAVELDGKVAQIADTGGFILGLAVDGDDRIYACDVGKGQIVRVDPRDGSAEPYAIGEPGRPMVAPNWPAFDSHGNLYVTDSGNWNRRDGFIWRVESDGTATVWSTATDRLPNGCCLSLEGDALFVVETNLPGVSRIPIRADGSAGTRSVLVELPATVPDGVAIAADGTLLVSCYRPDRIYRVRLDGHAEILVEDPEGQILGAPTNVAFVG